MVMVKEAGPVTAPPLRSSVEVVGKMRWVTRGSVGAVGGPSRPVGPQGSVSAASRWWSVCLPGS